MPAEDWEIAFRQSLIDRAQSVAAELKGIEPEAEERAFLFAFMLKQKLYCPECWVRYGSATTLHRARWLITCDEHDYKVG